MSGGAVRGWCPSAHRPMMSGDGLLLRVKPRMGRLTLAGVEVLSALALRFGNGVIDLTARGNLQIRGLAEADYPEVLGALIAAGLVDADPDREARRALVVTPFWRKGDLTDRLGAALEACWRDLPELPGKMGVAIDTGPALLLRDVPGDFRFERSATGDLLLRAGGARLGRPVGEAEAIDALLELARWFAETGGADSGRMHRHLARVALPEAWQVAEPAAIAALPRPGGAVGGRIFGVPFGQIDASALCRLMAGTRARHLRVTPWRCLYLERAEPFESAEFLSEPSALLEVVACPGAPACTQASVATRDLARRLAGRTGGTLHVSGCAKGCAGQSAAAVTLVGRNGRFDLVRDGRAGDRAERRGLSAAEVTELFE